MFRFRPHSVARRLIRTPGVTLVIVVMLALGIGVNTAILSIAHSLLWKPLPIQKPEEVVKLVPRTQDESLRPTFSCPEFKRIRSLSNRSFDGVIAEGLGLVGVSMEGKQARRVMASFVSGGFFNVLGLKPSAGRLFTAREGEVLYRNPVLVLGYDEWQQSFQGDPTVVGRHISVNGHPFVIIGVAPAGFHGVDPVVRVQIYMPLSEMPVDGTSEDQMNSWSSRRLVVLGRLRADSTIRSAALEEQSVGRQIVHERPDIEPSLAIRVFSERSLRFTGDPHTVTVITSLFVTLSGIILLLVCSNVSNLLIQQMQARERDIAVSLALGASRFELMVELVIESLLLALSGACLGIPVGICIISLLGKIDIRADLPIVLSVDFDASVFAYSLAVVSVVALSIATLAAWRILKADPGNVLRNSAMSITSKRHGLRDALVVFQIASATVLLVVAMLFARSLFEIDRLNLGFNPQNILNLTIDPFQIGYNSSQSRDLARELLARIHTIPGVKLVSHASRVPMGYLGDTYKDKIIVDETRALRDSSRQTAEYNLVSEEYFDVMGIRLLSGRAFTQSDNEHTRKVAVITASMANRYWPHQDPIGHVFALQTEPNEEITIIGVTVDTVFRLQGDNTPPPFFFMPYLQHYEGNGLIVIQVKTTLRPDALAPVIEGAIRPLAPSLPVDDVETMQDALYSIQGLLLTKLAAELAGSMALLGVFLSSVGLFGLMSYTVALQTPEIGLRVALGATRIDILKFVYRRAVMIVVLGLGIGLVSARIIVGALRSLVIASAHDILSYISVSALLSLVVFSACYPAARRALAIDPLLALRSGHS